MCFRFSDFGKNYQQKVISKKVIILDWIFLKFRSQAKRLARGLSTFK
jgi:hypothetical protein